jgi:3-deoxy-D-manno-octulosonate 8-phosphate phosphatase (KDO 8-P phosphatase)
MKTPLFPLPFDVSRDVLERAAKIKLVIFDVDGVLTDGHVILNSDDEIKFFDSKDGHGLRAVQRHGIAVGIITGRSSRAVERRATDLEIAHLYMGKRDKLPVYRELIAKLSLAPEQTAFVGDDLPDLPIMLQTGLAVTVANAHAHMFRYSHWTTPSRGGRGAAREVCDLLLFAHGVYDNEMLHYVGAGPGA